MEQIKQISQKLELEVDRVRVIASDLRELLLSKGSLLNKMFKVCEMSCALNLNVEDLQESLDEINKVIRSNEAVPAPKSEEVVKKKYNLENFEAWYDKFTKALKEQELKDKGSSQEQQFKILGSLDVLEKENKPIYPRSGPGLYEYLEANPKKEILIDVKNASGTDYTLFKIGNTTKLVIDLSYIRNLKTAVKYISYARAIIEKVYRIKHPTAVDKRNIKIYLSKSDLNDVYKSTFSETLANLTSNRFNVGINEGIKINHQLGNIIFTHKYN